MAVIAVSLAETLRPWRAAGITHLLANSELIPDAALEADGHYPPASNTAPESPYGAAAEVDASPVAGSVVASGPAKVVSKEHPKESRDAFADTPPPAAVFRPRSGMGPALANSDPTAWPLPWQELFSRTRPAPVVWSYAELGVDLGIHPCKERSLLLRQLISHLHLPKGSSAFWPVWLPENHRGTSADNSSLPTAQEGEVLTLDCSHNGSQDFFQAGLRLLNPRLVILLGQQAVALTGLPLEISLSFTQQVAGGILFVLLPDTAQLLATPALTDRTCLFLRSALAAVPGLYTGQK